MVFYKNSTIYKMKKTLFIAVFSVLIIPQVAFGAWWDIFTPWTWFKKPKVQVVESVIPLPATSTAIVATTTEEIKPTTKPVVTSKKISAPVEKPIVATIVATKPANPSYAELYNKLQTNYFTFKNKVNAIVEAHNYGNIILTNASEEVRSNGLWNILKALDADIRIIDTTTDVNVLIAYDKKIADLEKEFNTIENTYKNELARIEQQKTVQNEERRKEIAIDLAELEVIKVQVKTLSSVSEIINIFNKNRYLTRYTARPLTNSSASNSAWIINAKNNLELEISKLKLELEKLK